MSARESARPEPFATFGVLAAILAVAAGEGFLDAERFASAEFSWDGSIRLRLGIHPSAEAAAAAWAQRLGLAQTSRSTRPNEYSAGPGDRVWVAVEYAGRYAGHDIDLHAGWTAPADPAESDEDAAGGAGHG